MISIGWPSGSRPNGRRGNEVAVVGKIRTSLQEKGPAFARAAAEGHHINLGPGPALEAEWTAAGLELPDLDVVRDYRFGRVIDQLQAQGYDGLILLDPMNIRYATDSTNMQIWVMHNPSRYVWIGADRSVIAWEFYGCEFLDGHNPLVDEIRPAVGLNYFLTGPRYAERARVWADEMMSVITEHCGPRARIAVDQCPYLCFRHLEDAGVTIGSGQEVMELARLIKCDDEIKAMQCAAHACQATMAEMRAALVPGMTEREVWAMMHAGNIRRAGEWIETQILSSGPRTNPWMQEVSSRVIEDGDLLAYDTDLVGAYGMMVDISRTWLVGDGAPNRLQRTNHDLAREQIVRNSALLTPGRTFRELTFDAWFPPDDEYLHYCVLFHGVGQCDEYPEVVFPDSWDVVGFDGVVKPGMVFTTEAYVGRRDGTGEGVKLEDQFLVTEDGPELLTSFSLDL